MVFRLKGGRGRWCKEKDKGAKKRRLCPGKKEIPPIFLTPSPTAIGRAKIKQSSFFYQAQNLFHKSPCPDLFQLRVGGLILLSSIGNLLF